MSIIITSITIILYIILVGFVWRNLDLLDNKIKIAYILIGMAIMFLITLIVFQISAKGIEYQNANMEGNVRNILVLVFAPVNGLIVMPYLANKVLKLSDDEITVESFKKKIVILTIVFTLILIFECYYLKSIQLGIINVVNKM